MLTCNHCGDEFPKGRTSTQRFCSRKCSLNAWKAENREDQNRKRRERYASDETFRNRHNGYVSNWTKTNREANSAKSQAYAYKRRTASTESSTADVKVARTLFSFAMCANPACRSTENIEIDHIVPLSKGGSNTLMNFQPLCRSCNASKGAKEINYLKEVQK